jgi:DNA-binding transcriptional LysR family regulator
VDVRLQPAGAPTEPSKTSFDYGDTLEVSPREGTAMDLDLRKVRYFVAVAELLHFGRAAERLHIAQPVLSRQIKALEKDLDAVLFQRDSHGVTLTPAGRQLLDDARTLLAAADATRRRVRRAAHAPHRLIVGFRAGIVLSRALRAFCAARPDIAVEARRVEWDDQEDLILDGTVDLAYVRPPVRQHGLELLPLFTENRVAMLPTHHRLAGKRELLLADLEDEPRLRYADPGPDDVPIRTIEEKFERVVAGQGITLVPESVAQQYSRPDITYVPVLDADPDQVFLAWEANRKSPLVEAFVEALAEAPRDGFAEDAED